MTKKRVWGRQAAERLLEALNATDGLTCEQAQALLPAFVEAELAGQDVDSNPDYAVLLKHLDRCADCMELYVQLSQDLKALIGPADTLPQARVAESSFFEPVRERPGFVLRVFRGARRHFEFDLPVPPALSATHATLSGTGAGDEKREQLLSESVPEVLGSPRVSVALVVRPGSAELNVTIQDKPAAARWRLQFKAGDTVHTAKTDERGVATFTGLNVADLRELSQLTLTCVELD
jgi:hypothetical protein